VLTVYPAVSWAPRGCAHEYRAMHVVLAWYCYRMSSVRPSMTLRYRGHIGWISSQLVTRIISLGSSLLGYTASAI